MDPVLIHSLQLEFFFTDNMYISAFAILVYDYILTLHLEIKYIWRSKWSYTKVLFLLSRYLAFIVTFEIIYETVFLNISPKTCNLIDPMTIWLSFFKIFITETIICIRTWAMWKRNKVVGMVLLVTILVNFSVQCYWTAGSALAMTSVQPPYPGFRGCFSHDGVSVRWKQFVSLLVIDIVVVTLVAISAFRLYITRSYSELSFVIHRDGILFYVYLLVITGTNVGLALYAPLVLKSMLMPLQDVLYSVFVARILLNIRSVAYKERETELHVSYVDAVGQATSLQFAERSENYTVDGRASTC